MIIFIYIVVLITIPQLLILIDQHLLVLSIFLSPILSFLLVFFFTYLHVPFFRLLKITPQNRYLNYLNRQMITLFNHLFLRMKTIQNGSIPYRDRLVIYSNHTSYTDALCVLEKAQIPMAFTPKVSILKIPFINDWILLLGSFPIDRVNPRKTLENMVTAIKVVKDGQSMLMFPEGTIRDRYSEDIENMKAGSFKLALKAQADITVIKISGDIDIRRKIPFYPINRYVDVIDTYVYDDFKSLSTNDLSFKMMEIINQFKGHKDQ